MAFDFEATEDTDDCLAPRVVGSAGGPMDALGPLIEVRGLGPADETRACEGVAVRDAEELDGPLSCFVGDLAGDLACSGVSRQGGTGARGGGWRWRCLLSC